MSILDTMHFRALDSNFEATVIIDSYDSIIWADRYNEVGDFEIKGPLNEQLRQVAEEANYIFNAATSGIMIIEEVEENFSEEDGRTILIKGRSIESVLDRRIQFTSLTIFNPTDPRLSEILCEVIRTAFGPSDPDRYWDRLDVINETSISSASLVAGYALQFTMGENILDIVINTCNAYGIGFKCELSLIDKRVKLILYQGVNRTAQGENQVVFSDLYDNLLTASDRSSIANIKTVALVVGNEVDETTNTPTFPTVVGTATGLNRRELYYAADVDPFIYSIDELTNEEIATPMSDAQYQTALALAGNNELALSVYRLFRDYNGEIIETDTCKYGEHFKLGDIIMFRASDRTAIPSRLDEIRFSDDASAGKSLIPVFNFEE